MKEIQSALQAIDFDWELFLKAAGLLVAGTLVLGAIGRFLFGKRSNLNHAISSAIEILFVYAAFIVLYSAGAQFQSFIAPLPFINISGNQLSIFSFQGADYTIVCSQVLNMITLAFLANLINSRMPTGKKLLSWLFLRCLTVLLAIVLYLAVSWVFTSYLPEGIVTYAPTILLALLIILLCVGALKLLVGIILAAVHPLVGAFYTFFFATIAGKALTKAVLTTLILSALVVALNYIGVTMISIASAALVAYLPLLIVLLLVWYLVTRVF